MAHVSIIGTGNMGQAIAGVVSKGGSTAELFDESDAATPLTGDVVVLAVPYGAVADVVAKRGEQLAGKIVVDITNPIDLETFEPIVPDAGSGAEEVAAASPGAKVVKAFNTTFAGTLASGGVSGQQLDVLLASDDEEAKGTIASLVESAGLRAVDAGPLRRARQLEGLGYLHMAVQEGLGTGYGSAVKLIS